MKRPWLAWAAIVVPVWITLILCARWEPVLRDGWGHVQWHRSFATTPGNVWDFARESYLHNNPRLGQTLTMLVYTPGPWHAIVTPLVELLLVYLLALLALGRKPSLHRTDDALVFATVLGMLAATAPLLGQMLVYRPFTGNYLFGFVISLLAIAPYRLHADEPKTRGAIWIPLMLVLGFLAGTSNEHTGPALVAAMLFAIAVFWRRGERPSGWMVAGLVGVSAGVLALLYAPGQAIRYNGLAHSSSPLGRIADRSMVENLRIVFGPYATIYKLVPWAVLAVLGYRHRSHKRTLLAIAAAALLVSITLLVSPKQGGRLQFASICLACAALAGMIDPRDIATRTIAWLLAAGTIGFLLYKLIATYSVIGPEFASRFQAIQSAPEHTVVTVHRYSLPRSRWFLGEDFGLGSDGLRFGIAFSRGLQGVLLDEFAEANQADPAGL